MDTRKWFIVLLLLTLVCGFIVAPIQKKPGILKDFKVTPGIDLEGGAELTYRILYESEEEKERQTKKQIPQKLIDILRKRVDQRGLKEPRINLMNEDQIVIQLAVHSEDALQEYKDLLKRQGKLEEREVGTRELHERWDGTPEDAPEGWFAIKNDRKMSGDYDYLAGDYILVSNDLILTGTDFLKVRKEKSPYSGGWSIAFLLTKEAGDRFDQMAKKLYNQTPNGLSAIIVDGKIISKPVINAEKFGGAGVITGSFSEGEATGLVLALKQKPLPCLLKFHDQKRFGSSD